MSYQSYTIKPGQKDWSPKEFPTIWNCRKRKVVIKTFFHENCLYDWGADQDQLDWNKTGGMSGAFLNNNKNAIMHAWRPNPETMKIESTVYSHVDGKTHWGNKDGAVMGTIDPFKKEVSVLEIRPIDSKGRKHHCLMYAEDKEGVLIDGTQAESIVVFSKNFWLVKRLGTWFGGQNNAKGEFGGQASQFMQMWVDFSLLKP